PTESSPTNPAQKMPAKSSKLRIHAEPKISTTACQGTSGTPAGTYTITLQGAAGSRTHTVNVTLKVNGAEHSPKFDKMPAEKMWLAGFL
ncbi:MAG: hypothetical protein WAN76_19570, partial [Candidatus Sulfotelmatobacter sp.]